MFGPPFLISHRALVIPRRSLFVDHDEVRHLPASRWCLPRGRKKLLEWRHAHHQRRRLPRPQLGQRCNAQTHAPLVLGTRQSRPLLSHQLLHYRGEEVRLYELPIFMLARDGKVIADDPDKVRFEELGRYTDEHTGKPVGNVTRYTYTDGDERYVITYTRHRDLSTMKFLDEVKGPKKLAARLLGFDGAYLRFTGELRIEHYRGDELLDGHADEALWELMYFGHARP